MVARNHAKFIVFVREADVSVSLVSIGQARPISRVATFSLVDGTRRRDDYVWRSLYDHPNRSYTSLKNQCFEHDTEFNRVRFEFRLIPSVSAAHKRLQYTPGAMVMGEERGFREKRNPRRSTKGLTPSPCDDTSPSS